MSYEEIIGAAETIRSHTRFPKPAVASANPNHHLWNNRGTWWCHFTLHHRNHTAERVRVSLKTPDLREARDRRDQLFSAVCRKGEAMKTEGFLRCEPRRPANFSNWPEPMKRRFAKNCRDLDRAEVWSLQCTHLPPGDESLREPETEETHLPEVDEYNLPASARCGWLRFPAGCGRIPD